MIIKNTELQEIQDKICEIRGKNVILDYDLALLYNVERKKIKEAVRTNIKRFPLDFMFKLNTNENRRFYKKFNSIAFTEYGVIMLSSVIKSEKIIELNIQIVRAFIFLRDLSLLQNEIDEKLKEFEIKYDKKFEDIYDVFPILKEKETGLKDIKEREAIGFKIKKN